MRFLLIGALIGLWASAAQACEGQKGKVIFEDTFADDGGGWIFGGVLVFKAPGAEMRLSPSPEDSAKHVSNQTFSAGEGDYCLEIAFPHDQPDRHFAVGLKFLVSADGQTYFTAILSSHGTVGLVRHSAEEQRAVWSLDRFASAKLGPGQFNAIEAIVKDNVITVVLNGVPVKSVRAQIPAGALKFGIDAEAVANETVGATFPVKSFKVTEARKLASDAKTSP